MLARGVHVSKHACIHAPWRCGRTGLRVVLRSRPTVLRFTVFLDRLAERSCRPLLDRHAGTDRRQFHPLAKPHGDANAEHRRRWPLALLPGRQGVGRRRVHGWRGRGGWMALCVRCLRQRLAPLGDRHQRVPAVSTTSWPNRTSEDVPLLVGLRWRSRCCSGGVIVDGGCDGHGWRSSSTATGSSQQRHGPPRPMRCMKVPQSHRWAPRRRVPQAPHS